MTRALFLCHGASQRKSDNHDVIEQIDWTRPSDPIQVEGLEAKLVGRFRPISRDLLDIAYSVYAADRMVQRSSTDIDGRGWHREIFVRIPVRSAEWNSTAGYELVETLNFLTDDTWHFEFVRPRGADRTQQPLIEDLPYRDRTCVILFSGGLDSLAGAVLDVVDSAHRPLLLSHRSHAILDARQRDLVARLRLSGASYEHLSFWLQLRHGDREPTQRSRSFLFLVAATVIANECSIPLVHLFENGVISINLPIAFQVVGSRASRTTHPRFVAALRRLMAATIGDLPQIETPFATLTKTDVALKLAASGRADLIEFSSSCTRTRWQRANLPHCGVCSQCVDRRFAVEAAGLSSRDRTYASDLFLQPMNEFPREAEARGLIDGYIRRYLEVGSLSEQDFWQKYPELDELFGHVPQAELARLHEMYRRQSTQVKSVITDQIRTHATELTEGTLPDNCLLQILVADQALAHGPQDRYADRIAEVATDQWNTIFSGRRPTDEKDVQDQLEAGLRVARIELDREHPLFTYVIGIGTKPDFSDPHRPVWIEVKYVRRPGATPLKITEAISADLDKYERRSDLALFLIYDPDRLVRNPEVFSKQLQNRTGALIRVI
jgi:hypothetical protein